MAEIPSAATDPDCERGLYGKYQVKKIRRGDNGICPWSPDAVHHPAPGQGCSYCPGPRYDELVDPPGPVFVLAYTTDPHARVALEAYADSCAEEYPKLAEDLYRALGIDVEVAPVDMTEELAGYLGRVYQGRWVAVREGRLIAAGDSIEDVRARIFDGQRYAVLYVPREGERETEQCKGFQWIGQSWEHCDGCGQPYWEHDCMEGIDRDKGPFDQDSWIYQPISEESKARVKAHYLGDIL